MDHADFSAPVSPIGTAKLAVFVDIENFCGYCGDLAAPIDLKPVLSHLSQRVGRICLKRSFGDISILPRYFSPFEIRRMLQVNQVEHIDIPHRPSSFSKNSADIRLVVEAVAMIHQRPDITHLVVFSNDRDFIPLFNHAREHGKTVIGCGPARGRVVDEYVNACDVFLFHEDFLPPLKLREEPISPPRPALAPAQPMVRSEASPAAETASAPVQATPSPTPSAAVDQQGLHYLRTCLKSFQSEGVTPQASRLSQRIKVFFPDFDVKQAYGSFKQFCLAFEISGHIRLLERDQPNFTIEWLETPEESQNQEPNKIQPANLTQNNAEQGDASAGKSQALPTELPPTEVQPAEDCAPPKAFEKSEPFIIQQASVAADLETYSGYVRAALQSMKNDGIPPQSSRLSQRLKDMFPEAQIKQAFGSFKQFCLKLEDAGYIRLLEREQANFLVELVRPGQSRPTPAEIPVNPAKPVELGLDKPTLLQQYRKWVERKLRIRMPTPEVRQSLYKAIADVLAQRPDPLLPMEMQELSRLSAVALTGLTDDPENLASRICYGLFRGMALTCRKTSQAFNPEVFGLAVPLAEFETRFASNTAKSFEQDSQHGLPFDAEVFAQLLSGEKPAGAAPEIVVKAQAIAETAPESMSADEPEVGPEAGEVAVSQQNADALMPATAEDIPQEIPPAFPPEIERQAAQQATVEEAPAASEAPEPVPAAATAAANLAETAKPSVEAPSPKPRSRRKPQEAEKVAELHAPKPAKPSKTTKAPNAASVQAPDTIAKQTADTMAETSANTLGDLGIDAASMSTPSKTPAKRASRAKPKPEAPTAAE